jgi:hypothetical protein
MSDPTVQPHPADTYLAQVGAALADLPEAERAELLAEVEEHLTETVRELDARADDAGLVARLGSPLAYAAELRAGAGLAPLPEPGTGPVPTSEHQSIRQWAATVAATPVLRGSLDYLRDLKPAWWALRGYLLVALMLATLTQGVHILTGGAGSQLHTFGSYQLALVSPGPNEGHRAYLLLILAAVIASIVLGRAAPRFPAPARLALGALDLAAVVTLLAYPTWWLAPAFRTFIGL